MKNFFLCVNLFFLAIFLHSCSSSPQKTHTCDVLVSISPYIYFVEELTEGELHAVSLVPEGENPHLYDPSPRQVEEAKQAKVWIRLSEHFEKQIALSLQEHNKDLISIDLSEHLPLPKHTHTCQCGHAHKDDFDPHFWLSLRLAKSQASTIAKALIEGFPNRKAQIESRLTILLQKLTAVDLYLSERLSPLAGSSILVSHPAFSYFCKDYHLEQISIEQEGKDPLPQQITSILETIRTQKIQTVLTQAQYNNKGAEIIAKELKLKPIEVDPYSADYLNNFLHIANCIQAPYLP